ncbi:alpha-L-fucosidase [Paenibacillus filicis]|uniref:alpha-L-fucosidase n=2 Tax=Paenibacillus gyeongsangnamensis TaxID=3388067 RepID=A0ABT4Q266_9BACL|nr:alpha-L-fucosidase [Paenibacillus filicis]MCZ8510975.1 alpha-L-fucosidase [Paenibacillus filicis]
MAVKIEEAVRVTPSARQLSWQQLEFYGFIHFGINTFTGRQWGFGNEDPALFNPTEFDASQWVNVCRSAGMTGIILTCKHHDGFCLWPSSYTNHSVKSSPWKNGQGDMVREVADACRAQGLKFGVYLSPWDRHEPSYGDSPAYNAYFQNQLRELLTNYGEIFCVWFDGACGEGKNGKRQQYDWDAYYSLIRELQPNAVISICGPDVRWCGNEAGHMRVSEWSVVPAVMKDNEKIQANSQKVDDDAFSKRIDTREEDLGSREVLARVDEVVWYPSEVDTSIRPKWFYDAADDDQVKTVDQLIELYEKIVGGNACFLLNLPPDRRGLIHENDAWNMAELGQKLRSTYGTNLAAGASVRASQSGTGDGDASCVLDGRSVTFWSPSEKFEPAILEFDLGSVTLFDRIVLQEYIRSGQRIERFQLECKERDKEVWKPLYDGTVIGYKKICRLHATGARYIRLRIAESRLNPMISGFGVYCSQRS